MYLGGMRARTADLITRDPSGGILCIFRGRRVRFSFNTRVAIRKACDLLSLEPGDEVLAPAYNCGSELDPLLQAGLSVRLYPIDRQTRVNLAEVEKMIGPQTRAVYVTHYFGFLNPDLQALREICDRHGLWLIEDCALSLLSGPEPAEGHTGDVAVFCFHKFFPTFGGGALIVNNKRLSTSLQFDGNIPSRRSIKYLARVGLDVLVGENQAATLLSMARGLGTPKKTLTPAGRPDMPSHYYFEPRLQDAPISFLASRPLGGFNVKETVAARRRNFEIYLETLSGLPGVQPLFSDLCESTCPLSMPLVVNNRDALAAALVKEGISATPWWAGYHSKLDWVDCADACYLKDHVLSLPLHQYLHSTDIKHISERLQSLIREMGYLA